MKTPLLENKFQDLADILKGAMASLAGFAGRTGARIVFLVFAGNFYGAVRLGELASVIAVIEILVMIGIFGFRRSLLEFLENAKGKKDTQYSLIVSALAVTFVVATTVAAVLALLWGPIGLNRKTELYPLFAFIIPFIALMDVLLTATRFKRIIRYEVFARSLVEPWSIAGFALLFFFLGWIESGLLLAYVGSLMAAFLFALWGFSREYKIREIFSAKVDFSFIKRMSFFSGPTAIVDAIGIAFRRADIIILSLFQPDAIVGVYYGVQNFATVIQKVRHVFDPILSPVVNQTLSQRGAKDAGQQLAQVCRWILMLIGIVYILMAFYAGSLLDLIGPGFDVGALALIIVLAAEGLESTFASTELPFVFKKPWKNLAMTLSAFLVHLTGLSILIPLFGITGAGCSLMISFTVLNGLRLFAVKKDFDITMLAWRYLKPVIAGGLAFGALTLANMYIDLHAVYFVPVGIALGIAVYAGMFWVMGASAEDRDFVAYLKGSKKVKLQVDKDFDKV